VFPTTQKNMLLYYSPSWPLSLYEDHKGMKLMKCLIDHGSLHRYLTKTLYQPHL